MPARQGVCIFVSWLASFEQCLSWNGESFFFCAEPCFCFLFHISVSCPNLTFSLDTITCPLSLADLHVRWKVHSNTDLSESLEWSGGTGSALYHIGCLPGVTIVLVHLLMQMYCVSAECQPGFFRAATSGDKCEPCPTNTQSLDSGALFCPCVHGFYRAPNDPLTGPCSGNHPLISYEKPALYKFINISYQLANS